MNVELAERIIGIILMQPERLQMSTFFSHDDDWPRTAWPCGTTACIAGHAVALTAPWSALLRDGVVEYQDGRVEALVSVAMEALDLDARVAYTLFHHVTDSEAVMALKYLIGNPDASAKELMKFVEGAGDAAAER